MMVTVIMMISLWCWQQEKSWMQVKSYKAAGCFLFTEGVITEHPVIPIEKKDIVDTNGAGDAFVGGQLVKV